MVSTRESAVAHMDSDELEDSEVARVVCFERVTQRGMVAFDDKGNSRRSSN